MSKLRVGLVLASRTLPQSAHDLIERGLASEHYSIELLVVETVPPAGLAATFPFSLVVLFERLVLRSKALVRNQFARHEIGVVPIPSIDVSPVVSAGGARAYRGDDLSAIKQANLDALVFEGDGTLEGDVLDATKLGVFALRISGDAADGRFPPGFREVLESRPTTGFSIHRLSRATEGEDIVFEGRIPTAPLYVQNLARIRARAIAYLHTFLERLGATGALPERKGHRDGLPPARVAPPVASQVSYLVKTAGYLSRRLIRKLTGSDFRWAVAYRYADDWRGADLSSALTIANPPHHFYADPFVLARDGAHYLFVEDYDATAGKGKISVIQVDADGYRNLGVALDEPFHLSYPFLIEVDGALYMCPETSESRDIRLYRCEEFPLRWSLHKVLMSGVSAVDTAIFKFAGNWWMLTNIDSADTREHASELHVFWADSFDSERWHRHPRNPVVFDSTRARNGGMFVDDGGLFRVFQVHGFDRYGESMGVAEITELTKDTYREDIVARIGPEFMPGALGTHTLAFASGLLAADYVRLEKFRR